MPPPTQTTRPGFSPFSPRIEVGRPRGPRTAATESPGSRRESFIVVAPTVWKIMVIVPFAASASAMVSGILSPMSASTMRMMNWPALRSLATSGASMSMR